MKTKELFVFVGAAVFSISIFAKMNEEKQIRDLAFENIEALAENEPVHGYDGNIVSFIWNNTNWWGDKTKSTLLNWFPKYDTCRYNGEDGHQVYCTEGDGNCWDGTDCISD